MKVVIACGGSGGHIFPAVALVAGLRGKNRRSDILLIGSRRTLDKRIFETEGLRYSLLSDNKLPYKISFGIAAFCVKLFCDISKSIFILLKNRPDVVVGFGGYISAPVALAAYLLGIRIVVHEQNVVPGRANSALFRFAQKIAISFEDTRKYLGPYISKAVFTGNPIRAALFKDDRQANIKKLGLDADRFTILVIGGSQGAHNLNKAFVQALSRMDILTRRSLQIIHITGIADYEWATLAYKELGLENRTYSFMDRIEESYSASDLIVTRSGASAIFEIAYFGRPMILIPYPFAMSHQSENARVFSLREAAIQIDENELLPDIMKERITGLLRDRATLKRLGESARGLSVPGSSHNLAAMVMESAKAG